MFVSWQDKRECQRDKSKMSAKARQRQSPVSSSPSIERLSFNEMKIQSVDSYGL